MVEKGIGVEQDSVLFTFNIKQIDRKIEDFDCQEYCFLGKEEDAILMENILNDWHVKGYEVLKVIHAKLNGVECEYFIAVNMKYRV